MVLVVSAPRLSGGEEGSTGTSLEKASLEFKILKGESFGLSKEFFAVGKKKKKNLS